MQSLEDAYLSTLNDIQIIVKDGHLSATQKVDAIEQLLEKKTLILKKFLQRRKFLTLLLRTNMIL